MPRRGRHRARPGPAAVVHDHRVAGHEGRHGVGHHQARPGGHARAAARQPPARLPGLRQGRRVPAAGPGVQPRTGREPLRRGEAPLREADPDQRPGAARPRALHPVRSLHPLRRRGGRRPADPLHPAWQRDAGDDVPRPAVHLVLLRQHGADLPGRCAHRHALPLQVAPVGPRRVGEHVHHVLGRMSHHRAVEPRPARALPRRRQRRGQLGLAVRQGPLRLRVGQLAGAGGDAAGAAARRPRGTRR